ncbi:MAG TPA: hypothetical protein VGR66_02175, partial [Candidatus Eisenbacteria bacterium]|nr:hypothetical protein [Candidatus Eisenbacteria bacterium]
FFSLLADTTDPYPRGQRFITDPNYACEALGSGPAIVNRFADMIFDIEFCELATPTKRPTWGLLKATYR